MTGMTRRTCLLLAFALLALAPVTSHSGPVSGLTVFVNGQIADAVEVNANFAIVEAAIDDNHARISTLENLTGASCAAGSFITGFAANATLECSP